jgi:CelD/BcsL family acetyltransferase involved in cellulose biosynthesis
VREAERLRRQASGGSGDILAIVTLRTLDTDPACPPAAQARARLAAASSGDPAQTETPPARRLRIRRTTIGDIAPATWDGLAARSPYATPFSRWAFHRAWWDGYGATAHEETLLVEDPAAPAGSALLAILPLMHRYEVEPGDAEGRSTIRHGHEGPLTPVEPTAKAIFFGASYHADYATVLAAPADLPAVAAALVEKLAAAAPDDDHPMPWDAVDLRRLRCGDPAVTALAEAFRAAAPVQGWSVVREREDVCPVVTLPEATDLEGFLDTLDKKARHEIRRKIRRAEAIGEVVLTESRDPLKDLDVFIELHQKRWKERGLFPPNPVGDASRIFLRRLFEAFGPDGPVHLAFLLVGGRRIGAAIHFDDGPSISFYNAGVDPEAKHLSPGVLIIARYVEVALAAGRRRLDFLRGDESYKYEWGAVDEPIERILVTRSPASVTLR